MFFGRYGKGILPTYTKAYCYLQKDSVPRTVSSNVLANDTSGQSFGGARGRDIKSFAREVVGHCTE